MIFVKLFQKIWKKDLILWVIHRDAFMSGKNKEVIGLLKDGLGSEMMKEFTDWRLEMYLHK